MKEQGRQEHWFTWKHAVAIVVGITYVCLAMYFDKYVPWQRAEQKKRFEKAWHDAKPTYSELLERERAKANAGDR